MSGVVPVEVLLACRSTRDLHEGFLAVFRFV